MTEIYTIYSESGDEYKLQFTTERINIIAEHILNRMRQDGIDVVEIGLGRVKGNNVTSHRVLKQIEECIADFLARTPNAVLSYMCDFINLVPSNKQNITVHEKYAKMIAEGHHADFDKPE